MNITVSDNPSGENEGRAAQLGMNVYYNEETHTRTDAKSNSTYFNFRHASIFRYRKEGDKDKVDEEFASERLVKGK
jgi:hypothetical protein